MTRQAILLGWLRVHIKQTSSEGYGQIYVGAVNLLLMVVTIGLTIGFGKSDNLAAAYGIAVSLTMLMTSALLSLGCVKSGAWSSMAAGSVALFLLVIDSAFFLANLAKVLEGGYVPLLLAALVYGIMWVWHRGAGAVSARLHQSLVPIPEFIAKLRSDKIPRVPGTAVFLDAHGAGHAAGDGMARKAQSLPAASIVCIAGQICHFREVAEKGRLDQGGRPRFWRADAGLGFYGTYRTFGLFGAQSKWLGCTVDLDE